MLPIRSTLANTALHVPIIFVANNNAKAHIKTTANGNRTLLIGLIFLITLQLEI